jgi:phosphomannomutase
MLLSEREIAVSTLRTSYTSYFMAKEKLVLQLKDEELSKVLNEVAQRYKHLKPSTIDGVKVDFEESWVHLRKSNTEPIVRIYTEAKTQNQADVLAEDFKKMMSEISAEF